ncbi:uncharacterized protein LOC135686828 isoform X1 [Rhopilema esculentum]|uniref:uncharacterized protein LOC135686828 isoform X1 n=1 Tax=Rhopilema esculentum TaxID=499914 RepID=UPI0031E37400
MLLLTRKNLFIKKMICQIYLVVFLASSAFQWSRQDVLPAAEKLDMQTTRSKIEAMFNNLGATNALLKRLNVCFKHFIGDFPRGGKVHWKEFQSTSGALRSKINGEVSLREFSDVYKQFEACVWEELFLHNHEFQKPGQLGLIEANKDIRSTDADGADNRETTEGSVNGLEIYRKMLQLRRYRLFKARRSFRNDNVESEALSAGGAERWRETAPYPVEGRFGFADRKNVEDHGDRVKSPSGEEFAAAESNLGKVNFRHLVGNNVMDFANNRKNTDEGAEQQKRGSQLIRFGK